MFLLAFLVIAAIGIALSAQRRKALRTWAESHGLDFSPGRDSRMDDRFREFGCLRQGHSRYACNVSHGNWNGLNVTAFDYHYTTGHGKHRSHHTFSAVILEGPFPLTPLRIRREGIFDKVGEFFGFDDIDFESAEFSRQFHVTSPDRRWAYGVIHQRMMDYLLRAPQFAVQFSRTHIIAWRARRLTPAQLDAALGLIRDMLELMPDYLVQQQKERG